MATPARGVDLALAQFWQIGGTPPVETLTFLSRASATNRSFPDASGRR